MARKPARSGRKPAARASARRPATRARGRRAAARPPRATAREPRGPARARPDGSVTQAEYARRRGVSREAVRKAIADGRIHLDAGGRIDPVAADAAWRANTDPGRGSSTLAGEPTMPPTPVGVIETAIQTALRGGSMELPEGLTLNDARMFKEWNASVKLWIEWRQLSEQLVEAKDVEDAAFRAARAVRDQLMAMPERLGATLAATSDTAEVVRLLTEEARRMSEEFATKMFQHPDADEDAATPQAAAS